VSCSSGKRHRVGTGDPIEEYLCEKGPQSLHAVENHILDGFRAKKSIIYAAIFSDPRNRFAKQRNGLVALKLENGEHRASSEPPGGGEVTGGVL